MNIDDLIRGNVPFRHVKLAFKTDETPEKLASLLNYPVAYVVKTILCETESGTVAAAVSGDSLVDFDALGVASGSQVRSTENANLGPLLLPADITTHWDERVLQHPFAIMRDNTGVLIIDTRRLRRLSLSVARIAIQNEPSHPKSAYHELVERGFFDRITNEERAIALLADPTVAAYVGFDPTADSLHVGSLIPIMALAQIQRAGSRSIAVVGGATGLIGDPSGKSGTRNMLTDEHIRKNLTGIRTQLERFLRLDGQQGLLLDNADWFREISMIDYLRELGPRYVINQMIKSELYANRLGLEDLIDQRDILDRARDYLTLAQRPVAEDLWSAITGEPPEKASELAIREKPRLGLSYLEFSYQILQGYDFVWLAEEHNCLIEMGGSDQWGNILAGRDLGKQVNGKTLFGKPVRRSGDLVGTTFPLLQKADGGKFGKTESGNVWLCEKRTPVHAYFQFWRNADDLDVARYLGLFTFLPMDAICRLTRSLEMRNINTAKEILATATTVLAHGKEKTLDALRTARSLFGGYGQTFLEEAITLELLTEEEAKQLTGEVSNLAIPTLDIAYDDLTSGAWPILRVLRKLEFAMSNNEGRKLIEGGGVTVNGVRVQSQDIILKAESGSTIQIRVGKKKHGEINVL